MQVDSTTVLSSMLLYAVHLLFTVQSVKSQTTIDEDTVSQAPKAYKLKILPAKELDIQLSTSVTSLEVDNYNPQILVYCEGQFLKRWKRGKVVGSVNIGAQKGNDLLQISRNKWLVLSTEKYCITSVAFTRNRSIPFVGCENKGYRDGYGTTARFRDPLDMAKGPTSFQFLVLTKKRLRIVTLSSKKVDTLTFLYQPQNLPLGIEKMVWSKQTLILCSPYVCYRSHIQSNNQSASFISSIERFQWEPSDNSKIGFIGKKLSSHVAGVVRVRREDVFLIAFLGKDGPFVILNLSSNKSIHLATRTDYIHALAFNHTGSEIVISENNNICTMKVSWIKLPTVKDNMISTTTVTSENSRYWIYEVMIAVFLSAELLVLVACCLIRYNKSQENFITEN